MNTFENIVIYLRSVADGKELMNSIQLEKVTGWSKKAQHDRRRKGTFPFPYQNNGRLFFYSIYDVANFLLNGSQSQPQQATAAPAAPAAPTAPAMKAIAKGSRSTNADDFSHAFTFATFLEKVTKEANFLNALQQSLDVHQREERKDDLTNQLTHKEEVKDKGRKRI